MSHISDRRDAVARVITEFSWSDDPRYRPAPDHAPTFATHPNGAALRVLRDHCDRLVRSRASYMSGDHVEDYVAALRARVALAAAIAERIPPARLARVTQPADLVTLYREIRKHATARQSARWDDVRDAAQEIDAKYDREPDAEPDPEPAQDRPAVQFDPGDVEVLVRFAAEFLAQLEVHGTAYPHVAEAYARTVTPSVSLPGETGLHALARRAHQRITAVGGEKFADYLNGLQLPGKWLPGDIAQLRDGRPEHTLTVHIREVRPDTQDALVDPAHEKYCIGDHHAADDLCGPNSPPLGEPGRPFKVAISDLHLPPVGYRPETDDDMAIVRYGTDTTWDAPA